MSKLAMMPNTQQDTWVADADRDRAVEIGRSRVCCVQASVCGANGWDMFTGTAEGRVSFTQLPYVRMSKPLWGMGDVCEGLGIIGGHRRAHSSEVICPSIPPLCIQLN